MLLAGDLVILRAGAIVAVLGLGIPLVVADQSAHGLDGLLQELHAPDWHTRSRAVDELAMHPGMWSAPATKRAVIQLLDRENRSLRDAHPSADIRSDADSEAYGRYHSTLLGRVESLVDPGDVTSVTILVQSPYNPDSAFALRLAAYGETAVPALFEIADRERGIPRGNACEMLGRVLRSHRMGTSQYPLTTQSIRGIEERIRTGLRDPAPVVRMLAIHAVIAAADAASIPILEELRAADPYVLDTTGRFWIREQAAKAIAAIQADPLGKPQRDQKK